MEQYKRRCLWQEYNMVDKEGLFGGVHQWLFLAFMGINPNFHAIWYQIWHLPLFKNVSAAKKNKNAHKLSHH